MTASPDTVLTKAYELIEANQIDEAREMVQPLLDDHPDDPDVWWVYAHSVTDPAEAQRALERVRALDAGAYPEVDGLLNELKLDEPAKPGGIRRLQPPPPPTIPTETDSFDDDFEGDDFDDELDFEPASDETRSSRGRFPIIAAVVGVLAIAAVLLVLFASGLFSSTPPPPPATTQVAAQSSPVNATEDGAALGVPEVATEAMTDEVEIAATATDTESPTVTPVAEQTEEVVIVAQSGATDEAMAAMTEETLVEAVETEDRAIAETAEAIMATEEMVVMTEEATVTPTDEPTSTSTPTEEPTETPSPEPSPTNTPEPTPTTDPVEALESQFEDFELDEAAPFIATETDSGNTLLAAICVPDDEARLTLLQEGMATIANNINDVPVTVDAVGVALQDCERERTRRTIIVTRETAEAFASGEIDGDIF
ncbi:MAG: hypothetical protein AAGK74_03630, partial [Chloroflexota bacterium]